MRGRCYCWDVVQQHKAIQLVIWNCSSKDVRVRRCSDASIISSFTSRSQRHVWRPPPFLLRPRFWLGRWRASLWRRSEPRRRPLWPPTAATSTPSSAGSCAFWVSGTRRDWRLFSSCAVRHRGSLRRFCEPPPQFRPPVASFQFASVDLFSSSSCLSKFSLKVHCVKLCSPQIYKYVRCKKSNKLY